MSDATENIDDGLTDAERAALAEDDDDTGEVTGEVSPGDEELPKVEGDKGEKVPTEAQEKEAGKEPAKVVEPEPEAEQKSAPILISPQPEDTDAKIADIATRKDALLTQFDDGDITAKDYQKQLDVLSKEERSIEFAIHEAKLASKMDQQRLQNDWSKTCNDFIEANPVYKDNTRLHRALDAEVKELAAKPETANWTGQRFLTEAHKNLSEAFGLVNGKPSGEEAKPNLKAARELPPNLAKVPAADIQDTNGGRFAVLDRLANNDPEAHEAALLKMSDAERNAYLAS